MPAKKETPAVETTVEAPAHACLFCRIHIVAKIVICLFALFIGFSIFVAALGTGFAAGRFTSRGNDRNGMMNKGGYGQQYGGGMMNRGSGSGSCEDCYENGPDVSQGQGLGQCPVIPDNQSNGSGSEELPPNNAPVIP
jgi:hypothetical protein